MGLIGAWLGSLYFGVPTAIMWSIHRHRATLSAAPNFAFELCLKNVRDDDIPGLDLSSKFKGMSNGRAHQRRGC